jgi:hypothetical protein
MWHCIVHGWCEWEELSWGWRFLVVNPDWFCYEVMTVSKIQQVSW